MHKSEMLTLAEAAAFFGCHLMTLYRNWPLIPAEDRITVGSQKFISRHTKWRPNTPGRPISTYGGRTLDPAVRAALPDCPHDLSRLTPIQREVWIARIDALQEHGPGA